MMPDPITRRTALRFSGAITLAALGWRAFPSYSSELSARGYQTDPDLLKRTVPWPRTLTAKQLSMLETLCDIVLPNEPPHPSAAAIGVHEFLDEWLSAPYPQMQADRVLILSGLAALDDQLRGAISVPFEKADPEHQAAAFDYACSAEASVGFALRLIELICDGYYTTHEGHAAIGYVGNVGLASFPGPPSEVVKHLEETLAEPLRMSMPKTFPQP